MVIDIHVTALTLLKDFIKYSTGANTSGCVADAMYYCEDALTARAARLDKAVREAEFEDRKPELTD